MKTEDAEKLTELWTAAQPTVAAFVRAVVRDRNDAQDVLQQVAVKLVRNFARYDASRPFIPWAIGIAKNEVLAWRRTTVDDRVVFVGDTISEFASAFERSNLSRGESLEALDRCVDAVAGRNRQVLDLFYGQSLDASEVAKQMDTSVGAVRTMLSRTRELIRKCIEQRLAVESEQS